MFYTGVKVTRTYSTMSTDKKLLGDTIKVNKSATIKKRRLKNTMVKKENVEVVNIGEGDEEIDLNIVAATKSRRKEVQDEGRTNSSLLKSKSPTGMK